jgi:hypothetical protein
MWPMCARCVQAMCVCVVCATVVGDVVGVP